MHESIAPLRTPHFELRSVREVEEVTRTTYFSDGRPPVEEKVHMGDRQLSRREIMDRNLLKQVGRSSVADVLASRG